MIRKAVLIVVIFAAVAFIGVFVGFRFGADLARYHNVEEAGIVAGER
jgi:hypothetical protein